MFFTLFKEGHPMLRRASSHFLTSVPCVAVTCVRRCASKKEQRTETGTAASDITTAPLPTNTTIASVEAKSSSLIVDRIKARKEILSQQRQRQPTEQSAEGGDDVRNDGKASSGVSSEGSDGLPKLKSKKRAPWGVAQLRDSWSSDAMYKGEKDNMNERTHREYRYHPHEQQRLMMKWTGIMVFPMFFLGNFIGYYYHTGKFMWEGDVQYPLNFIRSLDTSPRSKFYPWRDEEPDDLPEHIYKYRMEKKQRLEEEKRQRDEMLQREKEILEAAIRGDFGNSTSGADRSNRTSEGGDLGVAASPNLVAS